MALQAADAAAGYLSSSGGAGGAPPMSENQSEESLVDVIKGKAPMPPKPKAPKPPEDLVHPFSHSVITHHDDGTHTLHHINRQHGHVHAQPHKEGDVRSGVAGHDEMLDHVIDHTGMED